MSGLAGLYLFLSSSTLAILKYGSRIFLYISIKEKSFMWLFSTVKCSLFPRVFLFPRKHYKYFQIVSLKFYHRHLFLFLIKFFYIICSETSACDRQVKTVMAFRMITSKGKMTDSFKMGVLRQHLLSWGLVLSFVGHLSNTEAT